jgi:lipid-binding SYLF domain-containing protein
MSAAPQGTPRLQSITEDIMKLLTRISAIGLLLTAAFGTAQAAPSYKDTVEIFKQAGESATFFSDCYAYAVFPNIGSGAVGIGGAYGHGRVYVKNVWTGHVTMKQLSVGFQAGGKAYSQIIFFKDKRALDEFESGKFEFGADASVTAITAGAHAGAGTGGVHTGSSEGQHDATTSGQYNTGMAVFIVAKGGLMAGASVAGQKFSYQSRAAAAADAEKKANAE